MEFLYCCLRRLHDASGIVFGVDRSAETAVSVNGHGPTGGSLLRQHKDAATIG